MNNIILELDMSEEIHFYVPHAEEVDFTLQESNAKHIPENA